MFELLSLASSMFIMIAVGFLIIKLKDSCMV